MARAQDTDARTENPSDTNSTAMRGPTDPLRQVHKRLLALSRDSARTLLAIAGQ